MTVTSCYVAALSELWAGRRQSDATRQEETLTQTEGNFICSALKQAMYDDGLAKRHIQKQRAAQNLCNAWVGKGSIQRLQKVTLLPTKPCTTDVIFSLTWLCYPNEADHP